MYINLKHKEVVENRGYGYIGTYEKNDILINKIMVIKSIRHYYIRIKCPYCCTEYDVRLDGFKSGAECKFCCNKYENSFAYHIEVELGEALDKYWDFEKNTLNPYYIYKNKNDKVWIRCTEKKYHDNYQISCCDFVKGNRCPYCSSHKIHFLDSFAQYHINNTDKDFLEKYWSDKNTLNPWELSPYSNKKIFIKCNKVDYHDDYFISCNNFTIGKRCPYCVNQKIHPKDSFGEICKYKIKYWSPNNKISPYKLAPRSTKKCLFICQDCKKEFERSLHILWNCDDVRCLECSKSKGEKIIAKFLNNSNIKYEEQKSFSSLIGLGRGMLSYDFYLSNYNLLIEFQGEQHTHYCKGMYNNKQEFEKQIEHDRRKFNYAVENGYNILYLYYWEINEIEQRLIEELQLEG